MTISLGVVGSISPAFAGSLQTPAFLAVAGIAAITTVLLYAEHPQITRRTVAALVPWMVVAAALSALAATAVYPGLIRPAVSGIGAFVTTYAVVCLAWFSLLQFAQGSYEGGKLPAYIGAMGTGAAVIIVGTFLVQVGGISTGELFWLTVAPIVAVAIAGVILLLLGLWYPEAAAYTGLAGGVVVFGHALAAVGTGVSMVATGAHTALSMAVRDVVGSIDATAAVGLDPQFLWVGGVVWTRLVVAILAVVVLAGYTHREPNRGYLMLGLIAAVGVVGGVTSLLTLVVSP